MTMPPASPHRPGASAPPPYAVGPYAAQPPRVPYRQPPSAELRGETDAALAARRELGQEYDEHIAAGLADRVEQLAAMRTAELRAAHEYGTPGDRAEAMTRNQRFALSIISLGTGIPITVIAALNTDPGILGVAVSWAGIVAVNAAFALGNRLRR